MILSIVAAHAWGVLQLILLGSFARTVRIRTVYAAMAVGLYLVVPLTVVLQASWTGLFAPLLGMSAPELVRTASHTLDPFVEALMKLLPLTLLLVPTFRRQWSFTDFVLIGAATGAGFGLAEDLYRFGGSADRAEGIAVAGRWCDGGKQRRCLCPAAAEPEAELVEAGNVAELGREMQQQIDALDHDTREIESRRQAKERIDSAVTEMAKRP